MDARADAFCTLIRSEIDTAETLLSCLKEEHEALKQLSSEALEKAVAKKLALLEQMSRHANERIALLERAGFSNTSDHVETFIAEQAADALPSWHRLVDIAADLEKQNQINGSMIQLSQQRTQMALDLATRPEDKPRTYGKTGYTEPNPASFTRVKA